MTTTSAETPIRDLLYALENVGESPHPATVRAIYERREEAEAPMLALFEAAYDDQWADPNDPRWYRFVHAGRFLMAWRTEAAIPIFARFYLDEAMQDTCEAFEEDPGTFGPPAVPHFAAVVRAGTGRRWHYGRALSSGILARIGRDYPETREAVTAVLREQLPPLETIPQLAAADPATAWGREWDEMWAVFIGDLSALQDEASREQILAMFDADIVDNMHLDRDYYLEGMNGKLDFHDLPYDLIAEYTNIHRYHVENQRRQERERRREPGAPVARPARADSTPKIGRNAPCPCGSGKKYKKCHGRMTNDE